MQGYYTFNLSFFSDDHYIMVSGGDDNAIHLALISVSSSQSDQLITLRLESSYTVSQSHAAQVTGLFILVYKGIKG